MNKNIEMLTRAKMYMEQLASGFDPTTGIELPTDNVLNNIKISRCLFFVADVLREVIENGGNIKRISNKNLKPFTISYEEILNITLSDDPIQISKFCEKINEKIDTKQMRKLQVTAFGKWLVSKGLLIEKVINEKREKQISDYGKLIGISAELRTHNDRQYQVLMYNKEAQKLLLDNLDEIIAISNGKIKNEQN